MGAGFESFVYADQSGMHEVKTKEEIPAGTPYSYPGQAEKLVKVHEEGKAGNNGSAYIDNDTRQE